MNIKTQEDIKAILQIINNTDEAVTVSAELLATLKEFDADPDTRLAVIDTIAELQANVADVTIIPQSQLVDSMNAVNNAHLAALAFLAERSNIPLDELLNINNDE